MIAAILALLVNLSLSATGDFAAQTETDKIKTSFSTKIGLSEGNIKLSYSSRDRKLNIEYWKDEEEKVHQTSSSSEKPLGLLIVVDQDRLLYSVEVLKPDGNWNPLADDPNSSHYKTRARLSQQPGWEILVAEKLEAKSVAANSKLKI